MTPSATQYFDQVAGQWDEIRSGYFTEAVRQAAIAKAYLRPEMVVADIGAGTGFMAAGLAPLVRKVHVIDGSPAMLEVARKNLSQLANLEYHLADGASIPLPDESLEAVFANMYLHHCPDPLKALREMTRLLKPGGRLVITDMDAHSYTWLKEEMADEWQGFEREQVRQWFKELDLVNVIADSTGQSCSAESTKPEVRAEAERTAKISVFLATGTKRVAMRQQVQSAYSAAAQGVRGCCDQPAQELITITDQTSPQASCCSGKDPAITQDLVFITGYSPEERAAVPGEAEQISLGCGNPIALANLKAGEVVLDIGSGGGIDVFLAARKVGPTGRVIGVDMTPAMLERARGTALKNGYQNVEFRQGQAEALPVEAGTVDVILSNCVINLTEDKGLVFREAFRALKPGGRLEVSDMVTSGALPLQARQDAGEWAGCVSGALPEQEYLDLIAQAGFSEVVVRGRSASGEVAGVKVYSAIVAARKPASSTSVQAQAQASGCGCS
jgi:ubiquinone/menaquinone biosynthesis C-methylase UbiE